MSVVFNGIYWMFRAAFYCRRCCELYMGFEEIEEEPIVNTASLPWFWIGAEYEDGTIQSITHDINRHVQPGMRVDPLFLKQVTNLRPKRWLYLDALTFEEQEFPSNGLVIQ
jgi:hypothetical protein